MLIVDGLVVLRMFFKARIAIVTVVNSVVHQCGCVWNRRDGHVPVA